MSTYFDANEVKKAISLMKPDGQLFECRMLEGSKIYSGYFTDAETLVNALSRENLKDRNVYITLNEIDSGCYGRKQRDCFILVRKDPTTGDKDIVGYDWLMVDLDPNRPSGTSSSDAELEEAKNLGNKVYLALRNLGFEKPLFAYSGNGVHLLYKINLSNADERVALVKKCLQVLDMMFSTERVKVDTKNFNLSRICKLYGCKSAKGADTKDRPHRMSHIIGNPTEIKVTDIAYLEKLANLIPDEAEKPQEYNSYSPSSFNLEEWMQKYGIQYKAVGCSDGTKYILDHCPFNENHKGKDAMVFRRNNGALSYICLHDSCADKHWKEFRQFYEPNAYEAREAVRREKMYHSYNRHMKPPVRATETATPTSPMFLTMQMIHDMEKPEETFVRTGIDVIDQKMRGLKKGHVSVWSGLRGSAKSTLLSEIGINARQDGNNVGFYSGELTPKNFSKWMNLQAAGKSYVKPTRYDGYYYVDDPTQIKIAEWMGNHLWLYNNDYGNNFSSVIADFEKVVDEHKLDLLVLDNLMAFDISNLAGTKWDAQTQFVLSLTDLAKRKNIHIAFVAHPRKSMGFLRFDDISGSGDLGNAVDDAFIVHRNNNDFKRFTKDMFGWKDDNPIYDGTNVVEIVKDRDGGNQDVFIPLYYEVETKRLKNEKSENIIYGWCTDSPDEQLPSLADFTAVEEDLSGLPFE